MTESVEKLRDLLETKRNYLRKEIVDYVGESRATMSNNGKGQNSRNPR